jgi:L-aspartate oxidase
MLEACQFRRESRGGHFRTDAPTTLPQWQRHSRQSKALGIRTRAVRS